MNLKLPSALKLKKNHTSLFRENYWFARSFTLFRRTENHFGLKSARIFRISFARAQFEFDSRFIFQILKHFCFFQLIFLYVEGEYINFQRIIFITQWIQSFSSLYHISGSIFFFLFQSKYRIFCFYTWNRIVEAFFIVVLFDRDRDTIEKNQQISSASNLFFNILSMIFVA